MIVDTHIHLYDPSRPQGVPWPDPANKLLYRTVLPQHCKDLAGPEGVSGAIVVEASAWVEDNQWILDLAAADPFILGLVGRLEPGDPDFAPQLERFAANPLFRGVRFWDTSWADIHQGPFLDNMADLTARGLVLDAIFPSRYPDSFFDLARRLPQLTIVIEHIAQVSIDGGDPDSVWVENMQRAAEYPHVSMKVSALMESSRSQPAPADVEYYTPTLDVLWAAFGEDRLFYGSNWPVCERAGTYSQCLDIVRTYFAARGRQASEKYLWENSKRIYQWLDR